MLMLSYPLVSSYMLWNSAGEHLSIHKPIIELFGWFSIAMFDYQNSQRVSTRPVKKNGGWMDLNKCPAYKMDNVADVLFLQHI